MQDDNLSLLSEQDSIDPDRASIEAERQSLYGDTEMPSDALSPEMSQLTRSPEPSAIRSPKAQAALRSADREAGQSSDHPTESARDGGPAPPDYAAATADPRFHPREPNFRPGAVTSYGAVSDYPAQQYHGYRGHPSNTQWSDSGAPRASEERIGLIATHPYKRKQRQGCCGGCCGWLLKAFCRFLLFTVAILALLSVSDVLDDNKRSSDMPPGDNGVTLPVPGDFDGHGRNAHPSSFVCRYSSYSETKEFDFDGITTFSLIERLKKYHDYGIEIYGYVWVVPANQEGSSTQESDLRVWTSIATTAPWSVQQTLFDTGDKSLEIDFPELERVDGGYNGRACMNIAMVVTVKQGISLRALNISTIHLDVKTFDDISDAGLTLDRLDVNTVIGDVSLKYWSSRETRIDTVSGDVSGSFALRDLLQITTVSGDVDADVHPKEIEAKHPAPAKYIVESTSGDIGTNIPNLDNLPERDYQVSATTTSGDIKGTYLFQTSALLKSTSGDLRATLLPYSSSAGRLRTETISGDQKVAVASAYKNPASAIKTLTSYHSSMSGKLALGYPESWEGKLEGDTRSGKVTLGGRHLEVRRIDTGFFHTHFSATKGHGHSHIEVHTFSGNVEATIGDAV